MTTRIKRHEVQELVASINALGVRPTHIESAYGGLRVAFDESNNNVPGFYGYQSIRTTYDQLLCYKAGIVAAKGGYYV